MTDRTVAEQLLNAQVTWIIARATGDELPGLVTQVVDDVLAAAEKLTIGELVDPEEIKKIARTGASRIPPSAAATTLVEAGAQIVHDNPAGEYTLGELIDRDNVARLTDEVLALTPVAERILDELTSSPLTASLASRFVSRIVNDVVAGNRAMAEKIPGVGSLVSFGAGAAGKMIGKAGEQVGDLFEGTAAKGAEFMMGRLNKIIVATLNDPQTRTAVLEVYDMYADRPAGSHDSLISLDDAQRLGGLGQDIVIAAAVSDPVLSLIDAFVDGFFDTYSGHPAAVVLEDVELHRDDLLEHANALAPRVLQAAVDSGELERAVRAQLAPFFSSPEVEAILGG
ncbi:MAG: hypothetical protein QM809_17130 [Gordonia sp. (in: high G+C Gram-positive bacteria)]|uniref:hypothetical protein n=1 Tax=Gordonia sp. (in: high G+C Gram-positive bacteria) TaxID=84139 RepID=UPI0039E67D20